MKYAGTIVRIQRSRAGITLIVDTGMGLRGVELDRELWDEITRDFAVTDEKQMIGWDVEYDPAHGDLDIIGPEAESHDGDEQAGANDHLPPEDA